MSSSPSRAALLLLGLLTLLNVLNFVDRLLIASLAPLLIDELGLTRAQIGLLSGFAFVLVFTVAGMFLGGLADRVNRPRLMAAGLSAWSLATALSGTAQRFAHLVAARTLVGVGEATLTPAALSMLADVLPRGWLARAAGIYYAGVPVGAGLSLVIAGWLAPRYGWRFCFWVLGAAGLVMSVLLLALPDPRSRRGANPEVPAVLAAHRHAWRHEGGDTIVELARTLRAAPALPMTIAGGALVTFAAASAAHLPTWLVQERGFTFRHASYLSGVIYIVAGLCGNVLGGWFADRCQRRWSGGRVWSMVITVLACAPFGVGFLLLPAGSPLFYTGWFVSAMGTTLWYGPLFAVAQDLAPTRLRSTSIAFLILAINVFGVGLGPWITGVIGDARSLTAGLLASLAVGSLSTVPFALAARRYDGDRARVP